MALAFQTSTTVTDNSGGSVDVSPPSGLTTDDLWLIDHGIDTSGGGGVIDIPSGWDPVADTIEGADDGWPIMRSIWKKAGSSESAVTVTASGGPSWFDAFSVSSRWSGQHLTTPIPASSIGSTTPSGSDTTVDAPDVTVVDDGSIAVLHGGCEGAESPVEMVEPSGTTLIAERDGTSVYNCFSVAREARNSGVYAPGTFAFGLSDVDRCAQTFVIAPAAVAGGLSIPVAMNSYRQHRQSGI